MKFKNTKINIDGMTCIHCKETIEKGIGGLDGVQSIQVFLEKNMAKVVYQEEKIQLEVIEKEIENLEYRVRHNDASTDPSSNEKENLQILGFSILLIALYLIINNTIGFDFIPEVSGDMGLGFLFVIGLLTSFHCISMCGGINLSASMPKHPGDSKLIPGLLYNLGRVVSYTILGAVIGALGSAVSFSSGSKGFIAIVAGVFMIVMGLNMLNIFPSLRKINPRIPLFLRKFAKTEKKGKGPFVVGLLNGFIPCGPLATMQIYALGTGSVLRGALSLFFFSLGTVPLMLGLGVLGAYLGGKFAGKMMKIGSILVIILGLIMMGRGFAMTGINMGASLEPNQESSQREGIEGSTEFSKREVNSPSNQSEKGITTIKDGKQIVRSDLSGRTYHPISVQKGIPVQWIIDARKQDITGCNQVLTVPDYNIEKKLFPGENIIEFTPTKSGKIGYTCWMGMISSTIDVVEDVQKK